MVIRPRQIFHCSIGLSATTSPNGKAIRSKYSGAYKGERAGAACTYARGRSPAGQADQFICLNGPRRRSHRPAPPQARQVGQVYSS